MKTAINIGNKFALGYKHTPEAIEKIRLAGLGRKHSKETKKKMSERAKGNKRCLGHKFTPEQNLRNSLSKLGIKRSEESKKNISEAHKGLLVGSKHPQWKGGTSYLPYSVDWTKTLKRSIRERDKYTCQVCGREQEDKSFHIHHIDYDKKNCDPNNLITLCHKCHMKTNFNRNKWIKIFTKERK